MKSVHIFLLFIFLSSCSKPEVKEPIVYEGPVREISNMELFYTEGNLVKVKMKAAVVNEYPSGDQDFPKGIYLEFYDDFGNLETTLKANEAYFYKGEKKWRARGDVIVKNLLKHEQLNTEELFWFPEKKLIRSEKFVTIRQQGDVIYGEGMEAKQDLSDFEIKRVTGDFALQEDEL